VCLIPSREQLREAEKETSSCAASLAGEPVAPLCLRPPLGSGRWRGALVLVVRVYSSIGVRAWAAASKTVAMASRRRAWSSPSFPRSSVAGEVVEVVRPKLFSGFASLAGRGGEGRRGRELVLRFLLVVVVFFSWAAPAGRGGVGSPRLKLCRLVVEAEVVGTDVGTAEDGWFWGVCAVAVSVHRLQFRRWVADGFCGLLQEWRCSLSGGRWCGWWFGVAGGVCGLVRVQAWTRLRSSPAAWGVFCLCWGPCCGFFSLLDPFVMCTVPSFI
jgi:hypothetical protein